jgi:hypothetical protein
MRKLSGLLRRHAFHVLLFFVALVAFCKPVLLAAEHERPGRVMLEFFVPWGLVVLVLLLVGLAHATGEGDDPGAGERD